MGTFRKRNTPWSSATSVLVVLSASHIKATRAPSPAHVLPSAAVNVTVRFYVDDGLVGSQKIARIESHAQATASFNYLPIGMQPGTHRVRIEADLDGNGIIDSSRGEAFASDLFYRTTPGLGTGWTIAIGIAVFLPVLIATVAMRRRQRA